MAPKRKLPIYATLLLLSENILSHYAEDLTVHDLKTIKERMKPGQTWLWQVRPSGTWLVRWDEDPDAGNKNSLVESLIRSGKNGNWLNAQWHLIYVHEHNGIDAYGLISQPMAIDTLAERLPRPKPQVALPGERRYVYAGVR